MAFFTNVSYAMLNSSILRQPSASNIFSKLACRRSIDTYFFGGGGGAFPNVSRIEEDSDDDADDDADVGMDASLLGFSSVILIFKTGFIEFDDNEAEEADEEEEEEDGDNDDKDEDEDDDNDDNEDDDDDDSNDNNDDDDDKVEYEY